MFYDDLQDSNKKDPMQRLIALRQKAGIHCRSEVQPNFTTPACDSTSESAALTCMQCLVCCTRADAEQLLCKACHPSELQKFLYI